MTVKEEWDEEHQINIPVETETVKSTHGAMFECAKGSGVKTFCRDMDTLLECEE